MALHSVVTGDTWQSIADDSAVSLDTLLLANGCDPSSPPPDPEARSEVAIPAAPRSCVAPGNTNTIQRPQSVQTLKMQLYDDDGNVMSNVRYQVSFFGHTLRGTSPDGWVTITYPAGTCASVTLDWGNATDGSDGYLHSVTLLTEHYQGDFVDKIAVSSGSGSPSQGGSSE